MITATVARLPLVALTAAVLAVEATGLVVLRRQRSRRPLPHLPTLSEPAPLVGRGRTIPALDGMRAISVLLVIAYHLDLGSHVSLDPLRPSGGYVSVDVFFVLSGFLITSLLLDEQRSTGRIGLRGFYWRRARRLFPALAVAIGLSLALIPAMAGTAAGRQLGHDTLHALPWVVGYVGNWRQALGYAPSLGLLSQTWTLSVEEQFYLLFPLVLMAALRVVRKRAAVAFGFLGLAVAATVWLEHLDGMPGTLVRSYWGSDTRSADLLLGAALGVALTLPGLRALLSRPSARKFVAGAAVAASAGFCFLAVWGVDDRSRERVAIPLASLATAVVILSVVTDGAALLPRVLAWRPLVWVGRRSYGLYLYAWIVQLGFSGLTGTLVTSYDWAIVAVSVLLAAASYRWVESPFLRAGRVAPSLAAPPSAPSAPSVPAVPVVPAIPPVPVVPAPVGAPGPRPAVAGRFAVAGARPGVVAPAHFRALAEPTGAAAAPAPAPVLDDAVAQPPRAPAAAGAVAMRQGRSAPPTVRRVKLGGPKRPPVPAAA